MADWSTLFRLVRFHRMAERGSQRERESGERERERGKTMLHFVLFYLFQILFFTHAFGRSTETRSNYKLILCSAPALPMLCSAQTGHVFGAFSCYVHTNKSVENPKEYMRDMVYLRVALTLSPSLSVHLSVRVIYQYLVCPVVYFLATSNYIFLMNLFC